MKEKIVFYIGYFDTAGSRYRHVVSPAGSLKMRYVAETIAACNYHVRILSLARPVYEKTGLVKSEVVNVSPDIQAFFYSFFSVKNLIVRKICSIFQMFYFLVSIILRIRKSDTLVVYHSLSYAFLIFLLRKCIGFNLILEVEEIYQNVKKVFWLNSVSEKLLFNSADAYIFPSELIEKQINIKKKPFLIIYGSYKKSPILSGKFDDKIVHIVYSGTFDPRKGGALSAIESAEFLDQNYYIHITGGGTKEEEYRIQKAVREVSARTTCKLSYDGFISDDKFLQYLQQFNIGLCTQNPNDQLSSSCFPSKILLYLSNGLTVLSSKAPAVVNSSIASDLFFYEEQNPKTIAEKIKAIPLNVDNRKIVRKLDSDCKEAMSLFLNNNS